MSIVKFVNTVNRTSWRDGQLENCQSVRVLGLEGFLLQSIPPFNPVCSQVSGKGMVEEFERAQHGRGKSLAPYRRGSSGCSGTALARPLPVKVCLHHAPHCRSFNDIFGYLLDEAPHPVRFL